MLTLIVTILAGLFSVVNPLGAIPMFLSLTTDYSAEERNRTSLLTSVYFILLLMCFFWTGTYILNFFGVSIAALRAAGGLVILLSGFALLSGNTSKRRIGDKVRQEAMEKEDISFTPMAMPMLSGPGSISLLIGYFSSYPNINDKLIIASVIVLMGIIIFGILRFSPLLFKLLGQGGLRAVARIMGFIVLAIGIEYIVSGVLQLIKLHW